MNKKFYVMYCSNGRAARKASDNKWSLGYDYTLNNPGELPSNEFQLSLKEAKNAKNAICKWDNRYFKGSDYTFKIVEYTVSVISKEV